MATSEVRWSDDAGTQVIILVALSMCQHRGCRPKVEQPRSTSHTPAPGGSNQSLGMTLRYSMSEMSASTSVSKGTRCVQAARNQAFKQLATPYLPHVATSTEREHQAASAIIALLVVGANYKRPLNLLACAHGPRGCSHGVFTCGAALTK